MSDSRTSGGIGLSGILWIVLIVLKILGEIGMSWFWVITGIIWIPLGLFIVLMVIIGIVAVIALALGG